MDLSRFLRKSLVFLIAFCETALLIFLYRSWSYDDPYITYRYAQNFANGIGFLYNTGERILSTTTPLFALLLGLGGRFWADIPGLAVWIGSISIGCSAVLMFELAKEWDHPIVGWVSLLLLPTFGLLSVTISSETPLYIALVLAVFYTYSIRRYTMAGLLAALLVLTRPDGALVPVILAVHFSFWVRRPFPWRGLVTFLAISMLGWGALWAYFGSPIPVTLAAKQYQGVMAISQGFAQGLWTTLGWYRSQWFFRIESILAILGLVTLFSKKSPAILLIGWTTLYFASYSFLGVTRYFWYYAPLIPGFIFLVGAGIEHIHSWSFRVSRSQILGFTLTGGIVCGLFFFQARQIYRQSFASDQRIQLYRAAGDWLREKTPLQSKVAALEVGAIGYYSQRYIVDFAGLIQPDVARQMKPDSNYEDTALYAIEHYQPEYVVIYNSFEKIQNFVNARSCQKEVVFPGSEYGSNLDLLIFNCDP
jgi:hypothetical protein